MVYIYIYIYIYIDIYIYIYIYIFINWFLRKGRSFGPQVLYKP